MQNCILSECVQSKYPILAQQMLQLPLSSRQDNFLDFYKHTLWGFLPSHLKYTFWKCSKIFKNNILLYIILNTSVCCILQPGKTCFPKLVYSVETLSSRGMNSLTGSVSFAESTCQRRGFGAVHPKHLQALWCGCKNWNYLAKVPPFLLGSRWRCRNILAAKSSGFNQRQHIYKAPRK